MGLSDPTGHPYVRFFCTLHHIGKAQEMTPCMVSMRQLRKRVSDLIVPGDWMIDSGAYSELTDFGDHLDEPGEYAANVRRWARCPGGRTQPIVAWSQDYLVTDDALEAVELDVELAQKFSVMRYREILSHGVGEAYLGPVLHGRCWEDYVRHLRMYGSDIGPRALVGVGSLVPHSRDPDALTEILGAIKNVRPDLHLHGFGIKSTALRSERVRWALYSCDSAAWSYQARRNGRNPNDIQEAYQYRDRMARPELDPGHVAEGIV